MKKADLGLFEDAAKQPAASYLFDRIFYDSDIEHQNIANSEIERVTVFTKKSEKLHQNTRGRWRYLFA